MNHSNFAAAAFTKVRSVLGKLEPAHAEQPGTALYDSLTGATFLELEPDLAKEAGPYTRQA